MESGIFSYVEQLYCYNGMKALLLHHVVLACRWCQISLFFQPEPEPANLQWSGQKIRPVFNLLMMCYDITSLSILNNLICMGQHIAI